MLRLRGILALVVLAAAAVGAVAAVAFFVDPTPPAESAIATIPATPPPPAPAARPRAVLPAVTANFVDRFQGIDGSRWAISDGWSNGPWVENDWRRNQVSLTPRGLAITLGPNVEGGDKPYSSGEISSTGEFRYGYFEARMRVPSGDGVVTGLFTFTRPRGNASWHEIDMEFVGRDTRTLELAYHVGGHPAKRIIHLPFDAADGFHTYSFEWQPDAIRWYVDNVMVHEATGARVESMTAEQRFVVNLWNTEQLYRWTGRIQRNEAPWVLEVSCIAQAPAYPGRSLCAGQGT